jgi:FkbM family methyltransferase
MTIAKIWRKLTSQYSRRARRGVEPLAWEALDEADAIITCNEVTDRHGTGVILNRIFGRSPDILSIRSTHLYPEHSLGAARLLLGHRRLTRKQSFERILYALNGSTVRRIVCVPYLPDELMTALVLRELFNAPLCTFLMDDNNIYSHGIRDELMREVLGKSNLRLAISPEMRDAYEQKYGLKFWVLPPVVEDEAVRSTPSTVPAEALSKRTGVLVGSLWSRGWLNKLRATVRESGLKLHWYGNAHAPWLKSIAAELEQDGITDCGFVPETELIERLGQYPYAIIPSGTLDAEDDRPEIARLSLPTRLPFLLAVGNMPLIVLGNPKTAAAQFLERFRAGRVVPYEPGALVEAVSEICAPEQQAKLRRSAAAQSKLFSAGGLSEWIWKSLELGEPCDDRFEQAFRRSTRDIVTYLDPPPPKDLCGDFALVYQALRRLGKRGLRPDFVVDVGASSGVWSDVAKRIFPKARFVLVDPLVTRYRKDNDWFFQKHPDFECVAAALSDRAGEAELSVSPDLYGSSLLQPLDFRTYETVRVPVRTLDEVAREKGLTGRGILKIDVQFTEHLVIAGAREFLAQVDVLLLELSLVRSAAESLLFPEMCDLVRNLGFDYYEDVGGWRSPVDGTTLQKDVIFLRNGLFQEAARPTAGNGAPHGTLALSREAL